MDTKNVVIPILWAHDHQQPPIGLITVVDDRHMIEFRKDFMCTREMLFEIFGGAGIRVLDEYQLAGKWIITKAEILEFSFCLVPAKEAQDTAHMQEFIDQRLAAGIKHATDTMLSTLPVVDAPAQDCPCCRRGKFE